ncbi:hypothetical protein ABLE94_02555 [Gordonia sp. VNK1]|uniref:hypothetical protein n=1 Tax=Gordonia oleivorans TaxID=3156618 RepID=UPI0032B5C9B8
MTGDEALEDKVTRAERYFSTRPDREAERRRQALEDRRERYAREDQQRADDELRRQHESAQQTLATDKAAGQGLNQQAMALAAENPLVGLPTLAAVGWMHHRRCKNGQRVVDRWAAIRAERGLVGQVGVVLDSNEADAVMDTAAAADVELEVTADGRVVAEDAEPEITLDLSVPVEMPPSAKDAGLEAERPLIDRLGPGKETKLKDLGGPSL